MLALRIVSHLGESFAMDGTGSGVVGAGRSSSPPPSFETDLYAYVPLSGGWSVPAGCDRKLSSGGGFVLSRSDSNTACDAPTTRYLWEHIPPRLAPRSDDDDGLLQLDPDDVCCPDDVDCDMDASSCLPPTTAPLSSSAVTFHPPPSASHVDVAGRVGVNFSSTCSAPLATSRPDEAECRTLHHSGGCLTSSRDDARMSERPEHDGEFPQIQVLTPEPCRSSSCSGRIKLEITAPCSSSVSVNIGPSLGNRGGCHSNHTLASCCEGGNISVGCHTGHAGHVPSSGYHVRQVPCCQFGNTTPPCRLPGPCVAPASPIFLPLEKRLGLREHPCFTSIDHNSSSLAACEQSVDEMAVLANTTAYLKESGWYYGMLSYQDAQLCLRNTAQGTFLVRDSFDRRFLFALTVQTAQGPTSVRVQFSRGRFRLDAPVSLLADMPTFANVNSLVERYARHGHVLYDQKARPLLRMRLRRPLLRQVPSLQHCCRLALHSQPSLPALMPQRLRLYLEQYPFTR